MNAFRSVDARRVAAMVALVGVLVAVQAVASGMAPAMRGENTGRLVGDTGFAYLYGVRAYAAAMLWSSIDPVYHEYYSDKPLTEQVELLPTIRMVQLLDPQFEQSYYVGAWAIARRGDVPGGLGIARAGVDNNPDSGLLRASYAQLLLTVADDAAAAKAQADAALGSPSTRWSTEADRYEGLAVFAAVYNVTGRPDLEQALRAELARMRSSLSEEELGGDHDHDGDGTPDH